MSTADLQFNTFVGLKRMCRLSVILPVWSIGWGFEGIRKGWFRCHIFFGFLMSRMLRLWCFSDSWLVEIASLFASPVMYYLSIAKFACVDILFRIRALEKWSRIVNAALAIYLSRDNLKLETGFVSWIDGRSQQAADHRPCNIMHSMTAVFVFAAQTLRLGRNRGSIWNCSVHMVKWALTDIINSAILGPHLSQLTSVIRQRFGNIIDRGARDLVSLLLGSKGATWYRSENIWSQSATNFYAVLFFFLLI